MGRKVSPVESDIADHGHEALACCECDRDLDSNSTYCPETLQSQFTRNRNYRGIAGMTILGNFARKRYKFRHADLVDHSCR